jgi:hypothetical protein
MASGRGSGCSSGGQRQGVDQMRSFAPLRMTRDGGIGVEMAVSALGMAGGRRNGPQRLLQRDAAERGISVRVLSREGIAGNCDIAIC